MSEFDIRNTDLKETEKEFERALRPLNFGDFQGQKKIVENLEIFVRAARDESDQQLAAHRCYPDIVGNGFFRVFAPNPRQPYRFSRQWRTVYTCSAESDPGSDYPYHFCHFHDDLFSGRNIKMESPGSGSMSGNGRIFCIYEISLFSGYVGDC